MLPCNGVRCSLAHNLAPLEARKRGRRLLEGYAPLRSPPQDGANATSVFYKAWRGGGSSLSGYSLAPNHTHKKERVTHKLLCSRSSQPMGARILIVLAARAPGKPRRRTGLARGTPFGTMSRNRAAQRCVRRFSRHKQPPGPLNPLFSSVLRTGYIQAEGEGFEPSRANAHPPIRPPPKGAGAKP